MQNGRLGNGYSLVTFGPMLHFVRQLAYLGCIGYLLLPTAVRGQMGVDLGFVGGPHLAWVHIEDYNNATPFVGGQASLRVGWKITPHIGLELQPGFSLQGQPGFRRDQTNPRRRAEGDSILQRVDLRHQWIKLPLVLTANTNPDRRLQGYTYLGPYVNILAGNSERTDSALTPDNRKDLRDGLYRVNFGATWGVGAKVRIWKGLLWTGELRAEADLRRVARQVDGYSIAFGFQTGFTYSWAFKEPERNRPATTKAKSKPTAGDND
jgi:hypothetical protein